MNLLQVPVNLAGVIIFGSVWFLSKNKNQIKIFLKKKTETGSNRPVSVRFFRTKTSSNRFGSVFPVWLGFLGFFQFGSVFFWFWLGFSGLARFFRFRYGSVWFFQFFAYKTEPAGFFKILIGLIGFFSVWFFRLFVFQFSRFNRFFGFFAHPYNLDYFLGRVFFMLF